MKAIHTPLETPPEQSSTARDVACSHARAMRAEAKGHYSRLFEKPATPLTRQDEGKLVELGSAMRYEKEREGTLTPRVG